MTAERVRELLKRYNQNRGRIGHLQTEIAETEREYEKLRRELIVAAASPGAQVISDVPRGTGVSDKVGELAGKLADGWEPPELQDMLKHIEDMTREIEEIRLELKYVDAWTDALPDREKLILVKQVIDGCTWRECSDDYAKQFGIEYSREGLRRVRRDALRLIYQIACK